MKISLFRRIPNSWKLLSCVLAFDGTIAVDIDHLFVAPQKLSINSMRFEIQDLLLREDSDKFSLRFSSLFDHGASRRLRKWKSKKVKTPQIFLDQAFEAIRVIHSENMMTISGLEIYRKRPNAFLITMIDSMVEVLELQNKIYKAVASKYEVSIPKRGNLRRILGQAKRLFFSLIFQRKYRIYNSVLLDTKTSQSIDEFGVEYLRKELSKRYKLEVRANWFLRHFKNIQHAATFTIVSFVSAELGFALEHQAELNQNGIEGIDPHIVDRSIDMLKSQESEIVTIGNQTLKEYESSQNVNGISSEEIDFLNAMKQILKGN